jgi:hypothetical protein
VRTRGRSRRLTGLLALFAIVAVGCSDTNVPPERLLGRGATPSTTPSPAAAQPGCKPGDRNQPVALNVVRGADGAIVALVPVYIDTRGPFTFTLDTGASRSLVDRSVVTQLHLKILGPAPGELAGLFGSSKAQIVRVDRWRAGQVDLPAGDLLTAPLGNFGQSGAGLLGSDVLSRFHSVTIDYENELLVLCG